MNQYITTLRAWIFNELMMQSVEHALFWRDNFTDNIESMVNEEEVLKRVNLFWNIHLAKANKDLFDARNFLSDDISIELWQKRFTSKVLPSIIRYVKT